MRLNDLADRKMLVPYLAAGWTAVIVLGVTVAVDRWGPVPEDPATRLLVRLAGGWIALLMGALVWLLVSEPLRLKRQVDEATEELERTQAQYRELYDQAPLAYLTLDPDGTVTRVNDQFEIVLGYTADEIVGQPLSVLFPDDSEQQDRADRLLEKLRSGQEIQGEELAMETRTGERIWVTFAVRSIDTDGEDGMTGRTLSMIMDITERKRAEERLEYYATELERSNEDLQQFAYVVSHDLQEPIRMIKSYLDLLERRYGEELDEDAHDFIEFAVDGADRMGDLIQGLLAYSRVGTKGEAFQPVDLTNVVQEVERDLEVAIKESGATVEAGDLGSAMADANQLRQLLQNLIGNAIKYNGTGAPHIRVEAETSDHNARIVVEDNGPGIPEDQRDRVFDVFHRVGARPDETGTGMGLAICKRIAERHGGSIRVDESSLGGARFIVEFAPDTDEHGAEPSASPSSTMAASGA